MIRFNQKLWLEWIIFLDEFVRPDLDEFRLIENRFFVRSDFAIFW